MKRLLFFTSFLFIITSYTASARIYFLGSGVDVYEKPKVDKIDPNAEPDDCSGTYKYTCTAPKVGMGTSCGGKYATPCVCPPEYNKDCSAAQSCGEPVLVNHIEGKRD